MTKDSPASYRAPITAAMLALTALLGCADATGASHRGRVTDAKPAPAWSQRVATGVPTSATLALGRIGERTVAYVADEDEGAIATVDIGSGELLGRTPVGGRPSSVLLARDGTLFVTVADRSLVQRYRMHGLDKPPRLMAEVPVAAEPLSLALSDDGSLFAVSGWGRTVTELDVSGDGLTTRRAVLVAAEPRGAIVSDGKVYVTHAIRGLVSVVEGSKSRAIEAVMVDRRRVVHRRLRIPRIFSGSLRELLPTPHHGVSRIERRATHAHGWVPLAPGRFAAPTVWVHSGPPRVTTGYGSTEVPVSKGGLIVLGPSGELWPREVRTGHPAGRLCTVPRGAAATWPGRFVVACDGLDALIEYRVDEDGNAVALHGFDVGPGVTGVAYDPTSHEVVSWSALDRRLAVVQLVEAVEADEHDVAWNPSAPATHLVSRDTPPPEPRMELGRRLFHEASPRISRDGRSCVSCHPAGRQDGEVWSSPTGPRQTPMLAGRLDGTEPFGWDGAAATLHAHVTETIQRLGGTGLPEGELDALTAYVRSMPGPSQAPSASPAVVARGRELFESDETGCASCHRADRGYTNEHAHVILEVSANAPSLRYVGGTAPYMHDGRFATLEQVLDATDGVMGHTAHLAPEDRTALLAFVRTL